MDLATQRLMMAAAGAGETKTYVDDLFSTNVYTGAGSGQVINNGIDNSTEGGMVWFKRRDGTYDHQVVDTIRGGNKGIRPNLSSAEITTTYISSFNNNGYTLGNEAAASGSGDDFAAWNFRKAPGFFDVVTYTGNGTAGRQLSHNLGCAPGMVAIKCTSDAHNWTVWHRGLSSNAKTLTLNDSAAEFTADDFNGAAPSSSVIHLSSTANSNGNGKTYVAYLWAGGDSTTDKAVEFDGATDGDALTVADFPNFRTNNFTVECWFYPHVASGAGINTIMDNFQNSSSTGAWWSLHQNDDGFYWGRNNANPISTSGNLTANKWYHVAMVRNGSSNVMYLNGKSIASFTESAYDYSDGGSETRTVSVGRQHNPGSGRQFDGLISNARITIGQALYTTNFNVPSEPLTQTSQNAQSSNVKLLCCNGSTATASTVTPGTITAINTPTVTTNNSIFDDTSANVFGENEDQEIIKCGSYTGNGSSTGPEINLGWEPQWILIKNASASQGWRQFDSMRGIPTGGSDARLFPNNSDAESAAADYIDLTSTGFKIKDNGGDLNGNGNTIIYMVIRRPDGYVGKPPELGTGAFAMDTGNGSSTIPAFDSNFPVDFIFQKEPASSSDNWYTGSRLTGSTNGSLNLTSAFGNWTDMVWDSNVGVTKNMTSSTQGWMFKRHAGFDVVAYDSPGGSNTHIRHSLSKVPEMMWVKKRDATGSWFVYHKGLNGGSNPHEKYLILNSTDAEASDSGYLWYAAPTSTSFILGSSANVNSGGNDYIAMLFASVDGISKVGSYAGSSSAQTITTGFQPRFVLIKNASVGSQYTNWYVLDTNRGWGSGDDKYLELNDTQAQADFDFGYPTSTGFYLTGNSESYNQGGNTFIYYAHA